MRYTMRIFSVIVIAAFVLAADAQDPNLQRGFVPGRVYDLLGIDSVGAFNGNLNVTIPLGQVYTAGPTLQYQFMLAYNSKVWEFDFLDYQTDADDPVQYKRLSVPDRRSNAGMGWTLTLGELLPPRAATEVTPLQGWIYVAPDGGEHEFYAYGNPDPVEATTVNSTYLRLRRIPANTASPLQRHEIDFPDGTVRVFNEQHQLVQIRDRFGNWVAIHRPSATQWIVTDGFETTVARTHTIIFENATSHAGTPYLQQNFQTRPIRLELATFDNTTAVYVLDYDDVVLPRAMSCGDQMPNVIPEYLVPLLDSVTLPDDTKFDPSYQMFEQLPCTSGVLRDLVLPTGGKIEWVHGTYTLSNASCIEPHPQGSVDAAWRTDYAGVTARLLYAANGAVLEKRTYVPELIPRPIVRQSCGSRSLDLEAPPEEFRNTISTVVPQTGIPLEKTVNYFSVFPAGAEVSPSLPAIRAEDYGLPLYRGVASGDRYLSSRTYLCSGSGCTDTVARTTYLKYADVPMVQDTPMIALDPRVEAQRVVEDLDPACGPAANEKCYVDTAYSEFDQAGHYQRTVVTGNLQGAPERTTFVDYTPDPANWLLNLYTTAWTKHTSGGHTAGTKTVTTFDPVTGVVNSVRTLSATGADPAALSVSNTDVITAWCRDAQTLAGRRGFVTSERYAGGDRAPAPANLCTGSQGDGHYFITHAYTFNSAALTGHTAIYAGTSHFIADESFDINTGRVRVSRDSAGVVTEFRYDASGRLTSVQPTKLGWSTYKYDSLARPASVIARVCPNGVDNCAASALTETRYYYDDLGRLFQERRKTPGAEWAATWTTFDAAGRKASVSMPVFTASGTAGSMPAQTPVTGWAYDHRGRVERETRPDTSVATMEYKGFREIKRYVADPDGPNRLRSTEQYDPLGRLSSVIEPSGPTSATNLTGANVTTRYAYDGADRLTGVNMAAPDGNTQSRSFTYDGRGFLTGEEHPESGGFQYKGHDARGHARLRLPVPVNEHSIFKQRYTYDAAERLVIIETGAPAWELGATFPEYRIQKEFNFSPNGRLQSATRENYAAWTGSAGFGEHIQVVEEYGYDAAGQVNYRGTTLNNRTSGEPILIKHINQNFQYNALGLPEVLSYPTCTGCGVPPVAVPSRNVSLLYEEGLLTAINGFAGFGYAPTGAPRSIAHENAIIDQTVFDRNGRPELISFGGWSSCGTPPAIVVPPASTTINQGASATLSVAASGSNLQYQWFVAAHLDANGVYQPAAAIAGATQQTYITPALTATRTYFVRVTNACKSVESSAATVTVVCGTPNVAVPPQSTQITSGGAVTLSVTATGTAPLSYQWYRGAAGDLSQPVGSNSSTYTTPPLTVTTRYWVRVTNACGTANSVAAAVIVPLDAPAALVAQRVDSSSIHLSWLPVSGAAKYEVWRRSDASGFSLVSGSATSPWLDQQRVAGTTYVYRVRALDGDDSSASAFSNVDLATMMTFASVVPGVTPIGVGHWSELLGALNALRGANGDPPVTWSAILPGGTDAPATLVSVQRAHLQALRQSFASARQALGMAAGSYSNPDLAAEPVIRAIHVSELQERAQ